MGCTCRAPARCPICNTAVRVPLTNLDRAAALTSKGVRASRRDDSSFRGGLRYLIEGSSACPRCGHSVRIEHSRGCVAQALSSAGVSAADRALILAKITFPEG